MYDLTWLARSFGDSSHLFDVIGHGWIPHFLLYPTRIVRQSYPPDLTHRLSLFSLVSRTHVKDLSLKAVTSTGMGAWSGIFAVLALKSLQNAMMLSPACPRAGPTGGEGFACPAGISSRMRTATSFAAIVRQHVLVLVCVCVANFRQKDPSSNQTRAIPERPNSPPFQSEGQPGPIGNVDWMGVSLGGLLLSCLARLGKGYEPEGNVPFPCAGGDGSLFVVLCCVHGPSRTKCGVLVRWHCSSSADKTSSSTLSCTRHAFSCPTIANIQRSPMPLHRHACQKLNVQNCLFTLHARRLSRGRRRSMCGPTCRPLDLFIGMDPLGQSVKNPSEATLFYDTVSPYDSDGERETKQMGNLIPRPRRGVEKGTH